MRTNPFRVHGGHFSFGGREQDSVFGGNFWLNDAQNILSGQRRWMAVVNEVSCRRDAKIFCRDIEFLNGQKFRKFILRPAIEFPLVTFAVGIFGGEKSTAGMRHVAQNIIQNVARRVRVTRVAAD